MTNKVKLAIFDADLRANIGYYPISESGDKIRVVSGGDAHFMPQFDTNTYLEFPKKFLGLTIGYEKIYFARKRAKACVNFQTENVPLPDPEELKRTLGKLVLDRMGEEKQLFPPWLIYIILLLNIGIAMSVFGVIG